MILRRIADAIKRQDISQIIIEILIVVVGIFLGLQVQAWYEEQQWQSQETSLLTSLYSDMLENKELTERAIDQAEQNINTMRYTAQILQNGQIPDDDDPIAVRAIATSTFFGQLRLNVDTYESMVQTGNITRLSNKDITNSLYTFDRNLTYFTNQLDFLMAYSVQYSTSIGDIKGWRYDPENDRYISHIRFAALLGDEEKLNSIMALFRMIDILQRDNRSTLVQINDLLLLLEQELALPAEEQVQ